MRWTTGKAVKSLLVLPTYYHKTHSLSTTHLIYTPARLSLRIKAHPLRWYKYIKLCIIYFGYFPNLVTRLEVFTLDISVILDTVIAGVFLHLICQWLDSRHNKK